MKLTVKFQSAKKTQKRLDDLPKNNGT